MRCVMSKGKEWANSSKGNNSQWTQRSVEWTWNEKIRYVWMHKNAWWKVEYQVNFEEMLFETK